MVSAATVHVCLDRTSSAETETEQQPLTPALPPPPLLLLLPLLPLAAAAAAVAVTAAEEEEAEEAAGCGSKTHLVSTAKQSP